MKKKAFPIFPAAALLLAAGCCCTTAPVETLPPAVTVTKAVPGEIVFDGKLSETFWQKAAAYSLERSDKSGKLPPKEKVRVLQDAQEKGQVKFAYDDKYFYVAAILDDNDLIAMGKDQDQLINFGDTFMVYLAPENALHYWNFTVAPNSSKSGYMFDIDGLYLNMKDKDKYGLLPGFEALCTVNGTVNKQNDRDKCWCVEMRFPLKSIARLGIKFAPGEKWRIMAARRSYSAYNYAVQISAYPHQPGANFLRKCFGVVDFR